MDRALQAIPRPRQGVALSSLATAGSAGGSISARGENARKFQNCKVEMTRCTINSKNLCIFALRGTCFPSIFSVSAVFLVVKGSYTDLHRFDPRRPYSIKTRIKTRWHNLICCFVLSRRPYSIKTRIKTSGAKIFLIPYLNRLADHIPLKQGLRHLHSLHQSFDVSARRPYSIKTRIKDLRR